MKKILVATLISVFSFNIEVLAVDKTQAQIKTEGIEVSTKEAKKALMKKSYVFIDVRNKWEYDNGHIKGIKLIPLSEIDTEALKLDKSKNYITVCGAGVRSKTAAEKMQKLGIKVFSMKGGMNEWNEKGFPVTQD
ncbi:MAG: rhodanese-like domain-containing protein [Candidatus Sericytochromatia bacterium]